MKQTPIFQCLYQWASPFLQAWMVSNQDRIKKIILESDPALYKTGLPKRGWSVASGCKIPAGQLEHRMARHQKVPIDVLQCPIAQLLLWRMGDNVFRVAEDGSYADVDDALVTFKDNDLFLVHPLELSDDALNKWRKVFTEYRIIQPFLQLHRDFDRTPPGGRKERIKGMVGRYVLDAGEHYYNYHKNASIYLIIIGEHTGYAANHPNLGQIYKILGYNYVDDLNMFAWSELITRIEADIDPSKRNNPKAGNAIPSYPGIILSPNAALKEAAQAWAQIATAIPDPWLFAVLMHYALADAEGKERPDADFFKQRRHFLPIPSMQAKILSGELHEIPNILRAMPGAWADAYTNNEKMAALRKRAGRQETQKEADRARWEAQAVSLDWMAMPPPRNLVGKQVWLYHGTTSAFLPTILKDGLLPGVDVKTKRLKGGGRSNVSNKADSIRFQPHVFLTANDGEGPASASWYARQAAFTHGGDPMILRVIVDWDDLEPDPDDTDIESGKYQFVIDRVPLSQIMEIDGTRRAKSSSGTKP